MSEKLDGVRGFWNGKKMLSRAGNPLFLPDYFKEGFPADRHLDGELWGGRGAFQTTVGIVKSRTCDSRWKTITYQVFDTPQVDAPFEKRMQVITDYFNENHAPYVRVVEHERCEGREHLKNTLANVESKGGEGIMLRQPDSKYVGARSSTLLKVKSFQDAEARVLSYEPGKGRHEGRVGALCVQMANGTIFRIGSGLSDEDRDNPPPIGSIVTYRFQELTLDGVPRFSAFQGVRIDMTEPHDPPMHKGQVQEDDA